MSYVIKADLEKHPDCVYAEHGVYVNRELDGYTSLRKAKKFASYEEAKAHLTEEWEVIEEVQ
jgi:hypothetical protein